MKTKNRAWVKNAALIFVTALLLLTFFSNTILNRSLPEVSGQYSYGGEISTAVRGTGSVEANEAFSVELDTSREIKRVLVKVGDTVEAGQAIFELEPTDSGELKTAITQLETLQYNYNVKLLSGNSTNYEIDDLREALEDAIEKHEKSIIAEGALEVAKTNNDAAKEVLRLANEEIANIEKKIADLTAEITAGVDEDLMTDELKALKKAIETTTANLEAAKKEYAEASAGGSVDPAPYYEALAKAAAAEGTALEKARNTMNTMFAADFGGGSWNPQPGTIEKAYDNFRLEADKGASANTTLMNGLLGILLELAAEQSPPVADAVAWVAAVAEHKNAQERLDGSLPGGANGIYLTQLRLSMENCEKALKRAEDAWDEATKDLRVESKEERERVRAQLKNKQTDLVKTQKSATDAAEALAKAEADAAVKPEQAADAVKNAQRTLEKKIRDTETSDSLRALELERDRKEITNQQETVDKLREKEAGTEVTTRYGGTVLAISAVSGEATTPGQSLATIEINGKGYTLTFSVTNEETQRVRIGDIATISSWGRSDTVCTLVAIKTDRDNPTRRKILEFDVTGDDVVAGQNLDVSVGARTQYYNNTVPNSAIREDADGKFVLVADAKSTPLGTRHMATRVDVEILDSDTKNTAISGDFSWSPFIITTSSKPIEPNTQVRLVG